ncbi:MAG: hypothetical protein GY765_15230 [bacterium]|nr:hypothetical protein [bacterium]
MRLTVVVAVLLLFFGSALPTPAAGKVDLAKLKKKEDERKKKAKKSKYVITNDNISKIKVKDGKKAYVTGLAGKKKKKGASSAPVGGSIETSGGEGSPDNDSGEESGSSDNSKEYWSNEKVRLTKAVTTEESLIRSTQLELNGLMGRYLNEERPFERKRIKDKMDKLEKAIGTSRIKIKKLKQDLEAFYTKARKAGVPPGWLR